MVNTPELWRNVGAVNTVSGSLTGQVNQVQLSTGEIMVAWSSDNAGGEGSPPQTDIIGRRVGVYGNLVGSEFRLNRSYSADDESNIDMAALSNGGYMALYKDLGTSPISALRLEDRGASLSIPTVDSSSISNYYQDYSIASQSDTSTLISYIQNDKGNGLNYDRLYVRMYDSVANTLGAEALLFQNSTYSEDIASVDSTTLTGGGYVVVAHAENGADDEIWFEQVSATGVQSGYRKATVTVGNNMDDRDPSVAALSTGGFVVAWENYDGGDNDIHYQIFTAGGVAVGGYRTLSTSTSDSQNEASVVGLRDGSFMIVYDDDANGRILAQHLSSTGSKLGDAYVVSSGGIGITSPNAIALKDGRVSVSWQENGNIQTKILDTRDTALAGGYSDASRLVGTVRGDTMNASIYGETRGWLGDDDVTDGGGINTIYLDAGNDTLRAEGVTAGEAFYGGGGTDVLIASLGFSNGTVFDLLLGTMSRGAISQALVSFDNVIGSSTDDFIFGNHSANTVQGGAGNDRVNGRGGNDNLAGVSGNDTVSGASGDDTLYGGSGNDLVVGGVGNDSMIGQVGNDVLNGENGNDRLFGDTGNDTLFGGLGNDILRGNDGLDTLLGQAGSDILFGGNNGDFLRGDGDADRLSGDGGSDVLIGGTGNDILTGGAGNDTLRGDSGADRFVFAAGFGGDTVNDWQNGVDRIDFSAYAGVDNLADFMSNASQTGASVLLSMPDGNSIRFLNTTLAQFDNSDFIF